MKKNSIAVIGAGKWGQALHFALSKNQECFDDILVGFQSSNECNISTKTMTHSRTYNNR